MPEDDLDRVREHLSGLPPPGWAEREGSIPPPVVRSFAPPLPALGPPLRALGPVWLLIGLDVVASDRYGVDVRVRDRRRPDDVWLTAKVLPDALPARLVLAARVEPWIGGEATLFRLAAGAEPLACGRIPAEGVPSLGSIEGNGGFLRSSTGHFWRSRNGQSKLHGQDVGAAGEWTEIVTSFNDHPSGTIARALDPVTGEILPGHNWTLLLPEGEVPSLYPLSRTGPRLPDWPEPVWEIAFRLAE